MFYIEIKESLQYMKIDHSSYKTLEKQYEIILLPFRS